MHSFHEAVDKFRAYEHMIARAEKLVSKYPHGSPNWEAAVKTLHRLRRQDVENYKDDRSDSKKRDLFRHIVTKSDDFKNPLGKSKQRQFKSLMKHADSKDVDTFKQHSDTLASTKSGDVNNPHEGIKKHGSHHYTIEHPNGDRYSLKRNDYKSYRDKDYWDLHHEKSGEQAGEFQVSLPHKEMKWTNIYSRFRGSKVSPKVYTTLAKHYGGIKSDPEITLPPGRGVWMHLKRQKLHGVEPLKGKEARSSSTRWDDVETHNGDQRYSYKHPPEVSKSVGKLKTLRRKVG